MLFKVIVGIASALGSLVIAMAVQNFQLQPINMFGASVQLPEGVLLIGAWASGLVASLAVWNRQLKDAKSQQNEQKWDVENLKLHNLVESDQIKLLQAKIDTLETALTSALDRAKKKS